MIVIDVWADVRCPWCWIGLRRLEKAQEAVELEVEVRHRSFLLEPEGPLASGAPMGEVAVAEWGMSGGEWAARAARIRSSGESWGLVINIDTALTFDSRPVHQLLKAAERAGVDPAMAWESVFVAHFSGNRDLENPAVLADLGNSWRTGSEFGNEWPDAGFGEQVLADHREAVRRGIRSIPSFVMGNELLSGDHSTAQLTAFIAAAGASR